MSYCHGGFLPIWGNPPNLDSYTSICHLLHLDRQNVDLPAPYKDPMAAKTASPSLKWQNRTPKKSTMKKSHCKEQASKLGSLDTHLTKSLFFSLFLKHAWCMAMLDWGLARRKVKNCYSCNSQLSHLYPSP